MPMDKVKLEERFISGELGQHRISMRHRPLVLLGLSVHRTEIDGEAKFSGPSLGTMRGAHAHFEDGLRSHCQKFVSFLLHEIELLRGIGALPNFDGTLLLFELDFHRKNIDRSVCAKTNAECVLEIKDHGSERILKTIWKVLQSASDCFRNGLIQLRFIMATDFDILVADFVTFAEGKIAVSNNTAEFWSFLRVGGCEGSLLVGQLVRDEELDTKFANFVRDSFAMQVPIVTGGPWSRR